MNTDVAAESNQLLFECSETDANRLSFLDLVGKVSVHATNFSP